MRCWSTALLAVGLLTSAVRMTSAISDPALQQELKVTRALFDAGRFEEAYHRSEALLKQAESSRGADSLETAEVLDLLVRAQSRYGRIRDVPYVERARRALKIKESRLLEDDPRIADSAMILADALFSTPKFDEARQLAEQALRIRQKAFGPESPEAADALILVGRALRRLLDYDGARVAMEHALRIQERTSSGDIGWALLCLSTLSWEVGDYTQAKEYAIRSEEVREKTLPPDHPDLAESLTALAIALEYSGDLAGGIEADRKALAIRLKSLDPDHPQVGTSLNNLGIKLLELGDYPDALHMIEEASRIGAAALNPDHPSAGHGATNIGNAYFEMHDYDRAERYLKQSILEKERLNGSNHPELLTSLETLARVCIARGKYSQAQELLERARAIGLKALGSDHPRVISLLNELAELKLHQGEFVRARDLASSALARQRAILGPGHPETAATLTLLGRVALATGRLGEAVKNSLEAASSVRHHLQATARILSEREALRYEAVRSYSLDLGLSVVAEGREVRSPPEPIRAVWDEEIRSRALVLDEVASRHQMALESEGPETALLVKRLQGARSDLARRVRKGPPLGEESRYPEEVRLAQEREEQAERSLAEKSSHFRELTGRSDLGLDAVTGALPHGSTLVAYVQFNRYPSESGVADHSRRADAGAVPEFVAFIAPSGASKLLAVPLGPKERIESLIRRWREEVGRSPEEADSLARLRDSGTALRRAIWDPIAKVLGAPQRVFVVSDGAINLVNLATLPTGTDRFLIETGPLIHYLAAERDLVRAGEGGKSGAGLLALGGADFDAGAAPSRSGAAPSLLASLLRGPESACNDFKSLKFAPLPGTLAEMEEVRTLWKEKKGGGKVDELKGRLATESALKERARGKAVIHFATHGFFLNDRCRSSFQSARGVGLPEGASKADSLVGENPLFLSGLALAGANRRDDPASGPDGDDGILTAAEVASLDLRGVEWAVLSACETGVGPVQAGEGVLGLRRAFQVAGARTVIMSLWPVSDLAAREWIRRLYKGRFAGLSTAEAVQQASLDILQVRRKAGVSTHPFYWGGFIASGDWR